jgi:4-carboxymuconolactone decarboxylase
MGCAQGSIQHREMSVEQSGDINIDKRMAQVVGDRPRIDPVDEAALPPEAFQLAVEIRAALNIPEDGRMTESFLMMLNHPELFRAQMAMGIAVAGGAIPARERELAVLRNAWICGAPYEWGEHVNIGKERCGITTEEVERCTQGSKAEGWTDHERAIMKAVEELHLDYAISDDTWAELAKTWDAKQLTEFPVLVGAYTMTAMQQNSLRYRMDHKNPGLGHR